MLLKRQLLTLKDVSSMAVMWFAMQDVFLSMAVMWFAMTDMLLSLPMKKYGVRKKKIEIRQCTMQMI
jgi:hypothetical protein